MDLVFARSRRRATDAAQAAAEAQAARVAQRPRVVLALVLLTVVAESTRLESSNAKPPAPAASAPTDAACPVPRRFRTAFATASRQDRRAASLLVATAYEESRMNPNAQLRAGATGLLQLMPATARELRLDGDDPPTNVLAGARYLRQMIDRFGSLDSRWRPTTPALGAVEDAVARRRWRRCAT